MNDKNKKTEEVVEDPVVINIEDGEGNVRSWKQSECTEHQLQLIRELEPISKALVDLETEFARVNRDKQYRLDDFIAAGNEAEAAKPEEK
jgi:hypothetical protein|tara:strand:+ start:22051 stop:22320 length:270 start_codon:yes stop_codon:yes gene_type:complete